MHSAYTQITFFTCVKGEPLESHLENVGYELLQRYTTKGFEVQIPDQYPGARERIVEVVEFVGDSKWIWSVFGVIQNWTRPVAT